MAKERRKEELYVTVPSLFRCPISMDVMRSPVSLSTGVTYDRSSIEKWLALGHNTCPATMQTLPSTHTTPNLTLRRLIHLWLTHPGANPASPPPTVISTRQAAEIVANVASDSDSLTKITEFMRSSEENLKFVAVANDSASKFVDFLAKSNEIRILERIVEILDLISQVNGMAEKLNHLILHHGGGDCLPSFITVLQKGSIESKIKSAKLLETIAINPDSQRKIAEKSDILHELHILSAFPSTAAVSLSALTVISTSRPAKKELIRLGIVRTVGKILSDYSNRTVGGVIDKALSILEAIATCTEGRAAIIEDGECAVEIVRRLMKCSRAATEHGITVLWSVCCLARDQRVQERVARVNGLTKVLLVMQSDCSVSTRELCGELVKVLRAKNTKSNLAPYETKTTHITPY